MTLNSGIHTIPLADYLADPCPSPSLSTGTALALLEQSPRHAWAIHPRLNPQYEPEEATKFDLGSACHAILLEGDLDKLEVLAFDDYKKTAARTARDAARKAGKIPVLEGQKQTIEDMVSEAQEAISKSELADVFKPSGGDSEQTILWQDGGAWCRSRPDRMSKDRRILVDYKTTVNAEPSAWVKGPMLANGCDLQAALGLRGIKSTTLHLERREPQFVFIVQETSPPYAVSFVGFGEQFKHYADVRLDRAIQLWGDCLKRNRWPGYPTRIAWMAPPPWKTKEWDEQVEAMDKA